MPSDFETASLKFTAREHHADAFMDPRAIFGTVPPPENPWRWLATMMRRAVTPYHPCSDLPKGLWDA